MRDALLLLCLLTACTDKSDVDPTDTEVDDTEPADSEPVDSEPVDSEPSDSEPSSTDYVAVLGATCPLPERLGRIELFTYGGPLYLSGRLYDAPNPWFVAPVETTATCAHHHFNTSSCGTCPANQVCGASGCVPEPRTLKQLTVTITSDGQSESFSADTTTGDLGDQVTVGDITSTIDLLVQGDGFTITMPASPVGDGKVDLSVSGTGNQDLPGAITATWTPLTDGSTVASLIPINHHAGGPTFTSCLAPGSAGSFFAEATMVDPLAVSTGLEFQGIDHVYTAAAHTPDGCVEFWLGSRVFAEVSFPK